jgi:hypothetical protein
MCADQAESLLLAGPVYHARKFARLVRGQAD